HSCAAHSRQVRLVLLSEVLPCASHLAVKSHKCVYLLFNSKTLLHLLTPGTAHALSQVRSLCKLKQLFCHRCRVSPWHHKSCHTVTDIFRQSAGVACDNWQTHRLCL